MNREHIRSICVRLRHKLAGEGGQVLPITLAALALGTLVVAPFLSHTSTTLLGSGSYGGLIKDGYAADSGVEHAIWSLTDTALASQLPNPGDSYSYSLGHQVNGVTPDINITRLTPDPPPGGAVGTIRDTVVDSYVFVSSACYTPNIIPVSGNTYAIAYSGSSNYGYLKTFTVAANGAITKSVIDTYTFSGTAVAYEPNIIHVSGNVYAIVCRGTSSYGYIMTVAIAANGTITKSIIDSYTYSGTAVAYEPNIIPISGDIYAIVCRGASNYGYLRTVAIAANGTITKSIIDSYTFSSTAVAYEPNIIPVSGNVYTTAYRSTSNSGYLKTFTIASDGAITKSAIDTLVFTSGPSGSAYTPNIIHVSGNTYAIAYSGSGNKNYLCTTSITPDGTIADSLIDSYTFDSGYEPNIIPVSDDVYAIAYFGTNNKGYLKTFTIAASGAITKSPVDTLVFNSSAGYEPNIIHISGDIYAIAYRGPSNYGNLTTVEIITGDGAAFYQIQSTAGDSKITAKVKIMTDLTVKVLSWQISRVS